MQWSIGSYVSSSGVMLWALLAPMGVMMFQGPRESMPWFFAYIVMTAISGFFDYYLGEGTQQGVNMQIDRGVLLAQLRRDVDHRLSPDQLLRRASATSCRSALDEQNRLLQVEQEKSERLLLNILPGADRRAPQGAARDHCRRFCRRHRDVRRHHQFHAALGGDAARSSW